MVLAPECRLWKRKVAVRLMAAAAAWLLCSSSIAAAQTASSVLPPTREEVTRPEPQQRQDQALRLKVEDGIERAPCALDGPEFKDIRFTIRGAEFEGLRGLGPEDLVSSYASLVGTEPPISVATILPASASRQSLGFWSPQRQLVTRPRRCLACAGACCSEAASAGASVTAAAATTVVAALSDGCSALRTGALAGSAAAAAAMDSPAIATTSI